MLLAEEWYQENLEMLDRVNSKKEKRSQFPISGLWDQEMEKQWQQRTEFISGAFLSSPLHTFIYSTLRMCQNFVDIQRQTVGEGVRQERKILSRVINQNATLEKKPNKWVYPCLIDICILVSQEEKNGDSCRKMENVGEKSPICLSCSCLFPSLSHTLENTLLHVDPLRVNLTRIKMLHTKQPHLLKSEILSSLQELDRQL